MREIVSKLLRNVTWTILKSLCCAIEIWADALLSDISWIYYKLDLLLCTRLDFTRIWSETNERSKGRARRLLVCNKFSRTASKIPWKQSEKSSVTCHDPKFTKPEHLNLIDSRTKSVCKSGSTFSSSEQVALAATASRLWPALCLCSPVRPASQTCAGALPQELGHWSCTQIFEYLLE